MEDLILTDSAAHKIQTLIDDEFDGDDSLMLRVFISGGGCSGFQYGFTFDQEEGDGDTVVMNGKVKDTVDSIKKVLTKKPEMLEEQIIDKVPVEKEEKNEKV